MKACDKYQLREHLRAIIMIINFYHFANVNEYKINTDEIHEIELISQVKITMIIKSLNIF